MGRRGERGKRGKEVRRNGREKRNKKLLFLCSSCVSASVPGTAPPFFHLILVTVNDSLCYPHVRKDELDCSAGK